MNPEIDNIDAVRDYLEPNWTDERSRAALAKVKQGYARRRTAKVGGAVVVAAVCLAVPIVFGKMATDTVPHHDGLEPTASVEVVDGFRITPMQADSSFSVSNVTDDSVRVEVKQGRSHFEIVGAPGKTYTIASYGVEIEVVGTSFDVEASPESVTIHLHEGSLAVTAPEQGEAFIMSGESERTIALRSEVAQAPAEKVEIIDAPEPVAEPEPTEPSESAEPAEPAPSNADKPARSAGPADKAWRSLAKKQDYKGASELILEDPEVVDRRKVEELFDAADAMRRSGHHAQAAEYLNLIAMRHGDDSRAGMAAHTRGRILSRRMNSHCDAAKSFGRARTLGLDGMLARDALAHETESLVKCGDRAAAARRLEEYRTSYPSGPHLGHLESLVVP